MTNIIGLLFSKIFFAVFGAWGTSRITAKLNYTGPDLWDTTTDRIQLYLSNSHCVTHEPQQLLENVVHVGGLHIKPSKPLPEDLQTFMNSSPQGKWMA